jgi:adenine-specific DNA-methyltransferase
MTHDFSVEQMRKEASQQLDPVRKGELGQFMTPARIADYMAYLFYPHQFEQVRLLDAGAGVGTLTAAFLERCLVGEIETNAVTVTAYEIDPVLHTYLERVLRNYERRANMSEIAFSVDLISNDFLEDAIDRIMFWNTQSFTHAILNPPYKKIHSQSQHRKSLRAVGIETVNLYAAFIALAIDLMADGGEIVTIIPRSFCNGPYYRNFRDLLLGKTAIQHIHLFHTRDEAFREDEVLQETVIIHLVKSGVQETVTVSTTTDDTFADYQVAEHHFEQIVNPDDPERYIHIPIDSAPSALDRSSIVRHSLDDLGIAVATGPIVDFRLKAYLRFEPESGTAPLLYPGHFTDMGVSWPNLAGKKPNAIVVCPETEKWLLPKGFYTVVRRFSSKEERRRIVAYVVDPGKFDTVQFGFENHLNVFHYGKQGIAEGLAYGLSVYLNSTIVDEEFRRFSGHTQVNATDLRQLKYPNIETLLSLGQWAKSNPSPTQLEIDKKIEAILWPDTAAWRRR